MTLLKSTTRWLHGQKTSAHKTLQFVPCKQEGKNRNLPLSPALIGLPIREGLLKHLRERLICPNGGVVQTARKWRFARYDGNILNVSRTVFSCMQKCRIVIMTMKGILHGLNWCSSTWNTNTKQTENHRKIMRKVNVIYSLYRHTT